MQNKIDISNYKLVSDNLKQFYTISFIILIVLITISLLLHRFHFLLLIAVLPLIYLYMPRKCPSCNKSMKRNVQDETVYYFCDNCQLKIKLKIGLMKPE